MLNFVATYGRSLYALAIGLFTSRWTLTSLGHVDYGLLGVVGGMISFVSFFNGLMSGAVGRFYAFAVGEAQQKGNEDAGLENCRRWFSVAVLIHTVLPTVLIVIGYPVGAWAVRYYLVIPPDRIEACIWVWRFSCLASFVGMVNVPFRAMYTAKQEIAELTIYGFATTTLNAGFLYYMITHPGFWLVRLSAWTCFLGVVPQLLICVMAFVRYRECRLRLSYLWDVSRMKDLSIYAGGRFICALAQLFSNQGAVVAVNKILGPARNAAVSIGNTVVMHASTLTGSLIGAMHPAIINAAGRGDYDEMRTLAYRMCKLATAATLFFAVPLIPVVDDVMLVWLKDPPVGAASLCAIILVANGINHLTDGHWMSIFACGKVTMFNLCESFGFFLGFAAAVCMMLSGAGIDSVGYGLIVGYVYAAGIKLFFGRKLCGLSVRYWIGHVALPLGVAGVLPVVLGFGVRQWLDQPFLRIVVVATIAECAFAGVTWFFVFDEEEKNVVVRIVRKVLQKFSSVRG